MRERERERERRERFRQTGRESHTQRGRGVERREEERREEKNIINSAALGDRHPPFTLPSV